MAQFDKNQVKEFITNVEDDTAEFIGAEFCAARLVGYISQQRENRALSDDRAAQLLNDAHHLLKLAKLGHKAFKLVRNPNAEMRIMVLAEEARERRLA